MAYITVGYVWIQHNYSLPFHYSHQPPNFVQPEIITITSIKKWYCTEDNLLAVPHTSLLNVLFGDANKWRLMACQRRVGSSSKASARDNKHTHTCRYYRYPSVCLYMDIYLWRALLIQHFKNASSIIVKMLGPCRNV